MHLRPAAKLPIIYHTGLEDSFDQWALAMKLAPNFLRQATEAAIRARSHQAVIEHESDRACGLQPDILTLRTLRFVIHYTIETAAIVVRGYSYRTADSGDGGGTFHDHEWHAGG
ncbi:MAG: hypothetical protein IT434_10080 [Phycisphaerales bacterium]|nr:hypothetical protein [Phycisphaerales bacterium]